MLFELWHLPLIDNMLKEGKRGEKLLLDEINDTRILYLNYFIEIFIKKPTKRQKIYS